MRKAKYIADVFLSPRFFWALGICVALFVASFYLLLLWPVALVASLVLSVLTLADYILLFFRKSGIDAHRLVEPKLSNGDENEVEIVLQNTSNMQMQLQIIDELPIQFQKRDFKIHDTIKGFQQKKYIYKVRPVKRGEYVFGDINIFATSPIGFIQRKYVCQQYDAVKVYPSFLQIRNKNLNGIANQQQVGDNKLMRMSNSMEFDHIKEYTQGDDIRTINWKATARKGQMMVNTFTDERSQQIYCVLDMGRIMKMPFNGMSLLDYSINASLMLSFTVLHRNDKVGVMTFNNKLNDILKASKVNSQLSRITEVLYKQDTNFLESNYEALMQGIRYHAGQRSLIMLFTNFETSNALERHMPYLKSIARKHLLCVVIFENKELKNIHTNYQDTLEGIYVKTLADRFHFEKKRIVKELSKEGILSIFTTPENLSTDAINKYLDLKNKRIL
ncbi:MAG: hypothetical protein RLZZ118_1448 [Bacteroidota bacterium]|jgi:uncharacterized protein (DUF58 family)